MAANQDLDRVFNACRKGAKQYDFRWAATGKLRQGSCDREAATGKLQQGSCAWGNCCTGEAARTEIAGTNAIGINVTECLYRLCRLGITF